MVRLKDSQRHNEVYLPEISIPYGAIKRTQQYISDIVLSEFQFLMVRLKVEAKAIADVVWKFQFLMVRLKVEVMHHRFDIIVFQFLMVRLKA